MSRTPVVARWLIALTLILALAGLQAFPAPAKTLPLLPTITPPVELPDLPLPTVAVPTIAVPTIVVPTVAVPTVVVPPVDLPEVEVPDVDLPDVDVPDVNVPDVDVPDVDVPVDVPDVDVTDPVDGAPVDPGAVVPTASQAPIDIDGDGDVDEADIAASAAISITVVNCGVEVALDADAVVLGSLDVAALLALGCVLPDGVSVVVTAEDGEQVGGGVTAAGALVVSGLKAGATVTVDEDVPDGHIAVAEVQTIVAANGAGLLFVNVHTDAAVTADLNITKITCDADVALDADAVVLGSLDAEALVELGCVFSDDVAFTVTGSGGVDLGDGVTAGGLLTVADLEIGARVRVEEVVPDGTIALTAAQTVFVTPGMNLQFVNVDAEADVTADLTINAVNCGADVAVDADAVIRGSLDAEALVDLGCEPADGVDVTVTGDADAEIADGATADGVLTVEDLDLATNVTVTQVTPDGFTALTETQTSVVLPGRELLFVNVDAEADVTADLDIHKLSCAADVDLDADAAVLGGLSVDALLDLGCELADDVAFTVTADAGAALGDGVTADGLLTVEDLAVGATVTVTETVPDGFVPLTEVQTAVVVPGLELIFVNLAADADVDADLTVTKVTCSAEALVDVDADLLGSLDLDALLDLGCTLTDDVAFEVTGDGDADLGGGLTVDGVVTVEGLTLGAEITVREIVPAGTVALAEVQTAVAVPGLDLLFVNVEEGALPTATPSPDGSGDDSDTDETPIVDADVDVDLTITNIFCAAGVDLDAEAVVLGSIDAEALLDLGCELTEDVAFTVTGDAGVVLGEGVTADGALTIDDLPAGATVTVTETVADGSVALTPVQVAVIVPGSNLLFVDVAADADVDVDLAITKITCGLEVEIDAEAVIAGSVDAEALIALGCVLTDDVAFTVTADGEAVVGDGVTADGLVTVEGIDLGATVTVRESVPAGTTALTEAQVVVAVPGLNLLFVNLQDGGAPTATPSGDAGTATTTPATSGEATATPTGNGDGDGDGGATATPASGGDGAAPGVDVDVDATVALTITKLTCGLDVDLDVEAILADQIDAAGLIDLGCELTDDVAFTVVGDAGATIDEGVTVGGRLTIDEIASGETVTVVETVPEGYTALTASQVAVAVPGLNLLFVNVGDVPSAAPTVPTATPTGGSEGEGGDATATPIPSEIPDGSGTDATATSTPVPDGSGDGPTATSTVDPDGSGTDATATSTPDSDGSGTDSTATSTPESDGSGTSGTATATTEPDGSGADATATSEPDGADDGATSTATPVPGGGGDGPTATSTPDGDGDGTTRSTATPGPDGSGDDATATGTPDAGGPDDPTATPVPGEESDVETAVPGRDDDGSTGDPDNGTGDPDGGIGDEDGGTGDPDGGTGDPDGSGDEDQDDEEIVVTALPNTGGGGPAGSSGLLAALILAAMAALGMGTVAWRRRGAQAS